MKPPLPISQKPCMAIVLGVVFGIGIGVFLYYWLVQQYLSSHHNQKIISTSDARVRLSDIKMNATNTNLLDDAVNLALGQYLEENLKPFIKNTIDENLQKLTLVSIAEESFADSKSEEALLVAQTNYYEAEALLQQASDSQARWDFEMDSHFSQLISQLPNDKQFELRVKYSAAINRGEIEPRFLLFLGE